MTEQQIQDAVVQQVNDILPQRFPLQPASPKRSRWQILLDAILAGLVVGLFILCAGILLQQYKDYRDDVLKVVNQLNQNPYIFSEDNFIEVRNTLTTLNATRDFLNEETAKIRVNLNSHVVDIDKLNKAVRELQIKAGGGNTRITRLQIATPTAKLREIEQKSEVKLKEIERDQLQRQKQVQFKYPAVRSRVKD